MGLTPSPPFRKIGIFNFSYFLKASLITNSAAYDSGTLNCFSWWVIILLLRPYYWQDTILMRGHVLSYLWSLETIWSSNFQHPMSLKNKLYIYNAHSHSCWLILSLSFCMFSMKKIPKFVTEGNAFITNFSIIIWHFTLNGIKEDWHKIYS